MAEITAKLVNELRAKTGQAMMECKKALTEVGGDLEKAIEYFRKKQRLPAGDGNRRRAALVDGLEALLGRELPLEDVGGVLDLPAAGARQVAAEQRLQHQDERVLLAALQPLPDDVRRDGPHLRDRDAHEIETLLACKIRPFVPTPPRPLILAAMHPEAKAIRKALRPGDADLRVIGIGATSLPSVAEVRAASAIILAGFAGALDPSLKVGDVILDSRIPLPGLSFRQGRLHTANALVATPQEKAKLFAATGSAAVDMETERVRLLAEQAGVPFIGLRAISDTAGEPLNPSVLRFIDATGRVRPRRLAVALLARPSTIRDLLHLGRCSRIAGASLGDAIRQLFAALPSPLTTTTRQPV